MTRMLFLAAVLLAAGCATTTPGAPAAGHSRAPAITATAAASTSPVTALPMVHDPGHVTGTIQGPCRLRGNGQLPDPRCTPGAYDPAMTAAVLCAPGYRTSTYRPPATETDRFKYDVAYPAYGLIDYIGARPSELDHLIPLELGGANDASNLWPEPGKIPNPKDAIERQLHDAVCTGLVSLTAAQHAIAANWTTAMHALSLEAR